MYNKTIPKMYELNVYPSMVNKGGHIWAAGTILWIVIAIVSGNIIIGFPSLICFILFLHNKSITYRLRRMYLCSGNLEKRKLAYQ